MDTQVRTGHGNSNNNDAVLDYVSENNTCAHVTVLRRETEKEEKKTQRKRQRQHRGKVIQTDTERGRKRQTHRKRERLKSNVTLGYILNKIIFIYEN